MRTRASLMQSEGAKVHNFKVNVLVQAAFPRSHSPFSTYNFKLKLSFAFPAFFFVNLPSLPFFLLFCPLVSFCLLLPSASFLLQHPNFFIFILLSFIFLLLVFLPFLYFFSPFSVLSFTFFSSLSLLLTPLQLFYFFFLLLLRLLAFFPFSFSSVSPSPSLLFLSLLHSSLLFLKKHRLTDIRAIVRQRISKPLMMIARFYSTVNFSFASTLC